MILSAAGIILLDATYKLKKRFSSEPIFRVAARST